MYLKVIHLNIKSAKPGIRFFLMRWVYTYELASISYPIKDIAVKLNLTDKLVSESTLYLSSNGYFTKSKLLVGKGRPSYTYTISEKLISILNDIPDSINHRPIIEDIITAFKDKKETHKLNSLSNATKLLLIVLVSFADECGVIRNIGMSDISKYTGMDRDRFHRHLSMLQSSGYLLSYTPGITGKSIFGISKGIYFLDLNNINFRVPTRIAGQLYFDSKPLELYTSKVVLLFSLVNKIIPNNLLDFCKLIECEQNDLISLLNLLKTDRRNEIKKHLQIKVEECASFLLSNHWGLISEIKNENLSKHIDHLLEPQSLLSTKTIFNLNNDAEIAETDCVTNQDLTNKHSAKVIYATLVKFVNYSTQLLTWQIKQTMRAVPENSYKEMNHCILPIEFNYKSGGCGIYRIISSYKVDMVPIPDCLMINISFNSKSNISNEIKFKLVKNNDRGIIVSSLIGREY